MTRLRFAPSPTGYLHIGGLRTALFSFLYAKQCKGDFILRLEDTDQQRLVEDSEIKLLQTLERVNLKIDESPKIGGPYGPYKQSERLSLYKEHIDQLVEQGHAYPCFCTSGTLEKMRKEQKAKELPIRYDRRCRTLTQQEIEEKFNSKEACVIRMKIPDNETIIMDDLIRGKVSIESDQLDDQVLLKTDGFPTYHLAMVVDDHYMKITHVVRGEEWLSSYPKHLLLFNYFNWTPPQFAHLPLILNQDRSKLSKRQGDVAVEDFLTQGYMEEALVNFVALLGWNNGDDQEIFTLEELIEKFSFERVGKSGAVFDREKLNWMNQQYIKNLTSDELFIRLKPYIQETPFANQEEEQLKKVCNIVQSRLITLAEIKDKLSLFFEEKPELTDPHLIQVLQEENSKKVLNGFKDQVHDIEEITGENFSKIMKAVQKSIGIKGKALWHPMRFAITLEEQGPELPLVVDVFGKEKCLRMIEQALKL